MILDDSATLHIEPLLSSLARRAGVDRPAFTHVDYSTDRAGTPRTLSWSELYVRVLAVAAKISELAAPSERVAVLCPQDLSYPVGFFGALAAGTIAVPLFAPEASSHASRLVGALVDCEATVWLTTESALESVLALLDDPRIPRPAGVVAVDSVDLAAGRGFEPPPVDLDAPAYLQYTSGSTREPAGAVITHRAVVTNVVQGATAFDVDDDSTCVGWIPFFHDMGLVLMVCLPAVIGARSVFSTPFDFVQQPRRWLEQLASHSNVVTAAPNFAFEYSIDRLSDADRAKLDLSGVRVAMNGAEPVRPRTIERFQELFGPCGFAPDAHRPSYGLAEATVFVTTSRADAPPRITSFSRADLMAGRATTPVGGVEVIRLVSAGSPVGQHVCVVDPVECLARADGEVGEVWVHGGNVAAGYWGQPERSAEVFDARLIGGADHLPADGWLRTGDLGVRYDGELYITGRSKDVIIVDGKNHYPQDIEETAQEAHPAVRAGRVAAFGLATEDGGESIVIVLERARGEAAAAVDAQEISRAVRRAVSAAHDLKLREVQVLDGSRVLRTSSGKIARGANRQRYVAAGQR
ncbi:MAG TPA: fatty acyl-AMP ligase [Solirubrobacteraceae bacterium]|nr:fatty acyl-AMP ligase [Solirubrobacteraceae bacterium]